MDKRGSDSYGWQAASNHNIDRLNSACKADQRPQIENYLKIPRQFNLQVITFAKNIQQTGVVDV